MTIRCSRQLDAEALAHPPDQGQSRRASLLSMLMAETTSDLRDVPLLAMNTAQVTSCHDRRMPEPWSEADAEAELRAASAKVLAVEDAVERAEEVVYAIENEKPDSPQAEADVEARMKVAEAELDRLKGELADTNEDLRLVTERWQDAGYLPGDEVEEPDDDDGWPLSPEEPS
jgi:hypothetical protein